MDALTRDEFRAYVGESADWYCARWEASRAPGAAHRTFETSGPGAGLPSGFNWPAFLLGPVWLAYRRLRPQAAVATAVALLSTTGLDVLYVGLLGRRDAPAIARFVLTALAVLCGTCGNRWVFARAARVADEVRSLGLPEAERVKEIARRGGTSGLAACVVLSLYGLAGIVAVFARVVVR